MKDNKLSTALRQWKLRDQRMYVEGTEYNAKEAKRFWTIVVAEVLKQPVQYIFDCEKAARENPRAAGFGIFDVHTALRAALVSGATGEEASEEVELFSCQYIFDQTDL